TLGNVAEIGKTPGAAHFRSCLIARRCPPVRARLVHPAAIASMNRTTRHYLPRGIHPLIGLARAPTPSKPSGARKSFLQSLDRPVPFRSVPQHAVRPRR